MSESRVFLEANHAFRDQRARHEVQHSARQAYARARLVDRASLAAGPLGLVECGDHVGHADQSFDFGFADE